MNFAKPASDAIAQTAQTVDIPSTISVNVGVPGNIKKVVLELTRSSVRDALAAANLSPKGYDVRVAGASVDLDSHLNDGQTVLLLRPVVGNLDLNKPVEDANAMGITVNVGVPGNIKKVVLAGNRRWTVGDALAQSGLSANGYEIRVSGEAVTSESPINDGQTVLLLRPVRGN